MNESCFVSVPCCLKGKQGCRVIWCYLKELFVLVGFANIRFDVVGLIRLYILSWLFFLFC